METITLEVKTRGEGAAIDVRRMGLIPAVFYGPKQKNLNLTMDYNTFRRIFEKAGQNTVLELSIDGGKEKTNVLVQDLQYDPVSDKYTHVDFKFVDLNKEIETEVPIEFTGESKAVRELQGTLSSTKDFITVRCLAKSIPHSIPVDISILEDFSMAIRVKDIALPEGVKSMDDPELVLANVVPPKAEEEEAPAAAAEGAVAEGAVPAEGAAAAEGEKSKAAADKES
jgi:large subunit ribosomal protein L25